MKGTIKDRNLEKLKRLNQDIVNRNYFDAKLENLYINEFEEQISKILILTEKEFLNDLKKRMKLVIEDVYSTFAFNNTTLVQFVKELHQQIYEDYYLVNKTNLNEGLSNIHSMNVITNFRKHCRNTQDAAIHVSSCQGKMLAIYSNLTKKLISHLVCLTCKAAYLNSSILLSCEGCNCDYYSSILPNKESQEYLPATWESYHCGNFMNDQMRCTKCKELFFIRIKDYMLYCKKCKFETDPMEIDWTCMVCREDFKSPVKIFNPMEYKVVKMAIKDAIISRQFAFPSSNPCCRLDIENTKFIHTEECEGDLFMGELNDKKIVVCDVCRSFKEYSNYLWCCPSCGSKYKSRERIKKHIKSLKSRTDKDLCDLVTKDQENERNQDSPTQKATATTSTSSSKNVNLFNSPIKKTAPKQKLLIGVTPKPKIQPFIKIRDKKTSSSNVKDDDENGGDSFCFDNIDDLGDDNDNGQFLKKNTKITGRTSMFNIPRKNSDSYKNEKEITNNIFVSLNVNNYISNTPKDKKKTTANLTTKSQLIDIAPEDVPEVIRKPIIKVKRKNSYVMTKEDLDKIKKETENKSDSESNGSVEEKPVNFEKFKPVNRLDSSRTKSKFCTDDSPENKLTTTKEKKIVAFELKPETTKFIVESPSPDKKANASPKGLSTKITTKIELEPIRSTDITPRNRKMKLVFKEGKEPFLEQNTDRDVEEKPEPVISKSSQIKKTSYDKPPLPATSTSASTKESKTEDKKISSKLVFKNSSATQEKENDSSKEETSSKGKGEIASLKGKEDKSSSNKGLSADEEVSDKIKSFNIDDFKILQKIGEGTWGKIYSVQDSKNNKYALKKLFAANQEEVDTFTKECELVNSLQHKHIVKMHSLSKKKLDTFTYAIYILMDLAEKDWDSEIKVRGTRSKYYKEEELIKILKQLIEPLAFLQKMNITHRDIKPQNLLVFKDNIYKICDFGEAKEFKNIKRQSTIRGTELYMSPLLYNGMKRNVNNITHNSYKSDLYSMGLCFLYAACLSYNPVYEIRDLCGNKEVYPVLTDYLKRRYSDNFIDLLKKMLEYEERIRMDCIEFNKYLQDNI